eukprot:COSAG01_NODE_475_length_16519_cov_168.890621_13_plen_74_part_00
MAVRRCMPQCSCQAPGCQHRLLRHENARGYYLERECLSSCLWPWKPVSMIDCHDATVSAASHSQSHQQPLPTS